MRHSLGETLYELLSTERCAITVEGAAKLLHVKMRHIKSAVARDHRLTAHGETITLSPVVMSEYGPVTEKELERLRLQGELTLEEVYNRAEELRSTWSQRKRDNRYIGDTGAYSLVKAIYNGAEIPEFVSDVE